MLQTSELDPSFALTSSEAPPDRPSYPNPNPNPNLSSSPSNSPHPHPHPNPNSDSNPNPNPNANQVALRAAALPELARVAGAETVAALNTALLGARYDGGGP